MGMFDLFKKRPEEAQDPAVAEMPVEQAKVDKKRVRELMQILMEYKAGKAQTDARVQASENWWKLRNQDGGKPDDKSFKSRSGWLHSVIVNKHADAMEAYPEAVFLPRAQDDVQEAKTLSAIVPCIFERIGFEKVYSDNQWQKNKTGTGVYKVFWDGKALHNLGDISIKRVSVLNLYWQPGVTDIQDSPYFFHTELVDKKVLTRSYPQLEGKLKSNGFVSAKFLYDDAVRTDDKATVIDCYYKLGDILHYCKFVGEEVLYASEDDPARSQQGYYHHGKYPYVFDVLYPIEGSPCGYGYVDLCRNPQLLIDILNTAYAQNAKAGAVPRYFSRKDGNINEEEFLDLDKNIVHVNGNVDEATLRLIQHNNLDGNYIAMLDRTIDELRETSGNTEAATGQSPSGVTAASGIAALQEAAGKRSKDATKGSYRAFSEISELVLELIRQFYTAPRTFRIVGQDGAESFRTYNNAGLQPVMQTSMGMNTGMRVPAFDIRISAQKKSSYTRMAQNELAMELYAKGFFNTQMADQALACLSIMDFDDKDKVIGIVQRNGTLAQKLMQYMQIAMLLSPDPQMQQQIAVDYQMLTGQAMQIPKAAAEKETEQKSVDNVTGQMKDEHAVVQKARKQANEATQPA